MTERLNPLYTSTIDCPPELGRTHANPVLVPDGYILLWKEDHHRLEDCARILSDLDRSQWGRHRGDVESQTVGGVSLGNPHLTPGAIIGYNMSGQAYMVPEGRVSGDPAAWIAPSEGITERPGYIKRERKQW